uniref:Protein xylosyltransferase n=1 Tax=Alexandrium catenella TaxID=2925 RepID=A0A7S1S4I5_ALECA|mmetsp:Transcript_85864/g.228219  ORF Transcript_85864/g.228219 Transcript_85864/m.228219 type:complete len:383 (+) Transcript_85864:60-1208(+)
MLPATIAPNISAQWMPRALLLSLLWLGHLPGAMSVLIGRSSYLQHDLQAADLRSDLEAADLRDIPDSELRLRGKLIFLMMAIDNIAQEEIWIRFFKGIRRGVNYEAYLHCTFHKWCDQGVHRRDIFQLVNTVPSAYCTNVVSPMLALLNAAIGKADPQNLNDKFIFVSSTTAPVKPFWRAHRMLTDKPGAALFHVSNPQACQLFKASQWSALSYSHARRMLDAAARTSSFDMDLVSGVPEGCQLCLDEFWPIVSIFGEDALRGFPDKLPPTLVLNNMTFTEWRQNISSPENQQLDISQLDPMVQESVVRADKVWSDSEASPRKEMGPWGPVSYGRLNITFVSKLRADPYFIFMRKITKNTVFDDVVDLSVADVWDKYILKAR